MQYDHDLDLAKNVANEAFARMQAQVEVTFQVDLEGLLTVSAVDLHDPAHSGNLRVSRFTTQLPADTINEALHSQTVNHAIDEIVPLDEPFMGTGEPLDYPGATGGSPGNVCNCRCTTIPVIEE